MKQIVIRCEGAAMLDYRALKPFQGDLKELADADYIRLKNLITENGFTAPFHVWRSGEDLFTLDGHQRVKTIDRMITEGYMLPEHGLFPVDFIHAESFQQAKSILLSHASVFGTVTEKGLKEFLLDSKLDPKLLEVNFKLPNIEPIKFLEEHFPKSVSFDARESDKDPDEVPEITESTKTKRGNVYKLGNHRLMCGDATVIDDLKTLMNGEIADLVLTDPPYGVSVVKDGMVGADFGVAPKGTYKEIIGDDTIETARKFYATACAYGFKNFIIWGGNYFTDFLKSSRSWIVWNKRGDSGIVNTFADAELAWSNAGFPARVHNQLWNGMIRQGEHEKRIHPTQKPIALAGFCMDLINECQSVYDPFGGSGWALIAAEHTKRRCFMMELSPDYCDLIVKRWEKFSGKSAELVQA